MATTKKRTPKTKFISGHILPKVHFTDYITRTIGDVTDLDVLHKAKEMQHNVLIYGPTGPGKTSAVMAYAAREGLPFYSIPCNSAVEPRQLLGGVSPLESTDGLKFGWVDGGVTMAWRDGGVVYLDECNMLHSRIATAIHSGLDKRRNLTLMEHGHEVVEAHEDLLVVGSYNPSDLGGYEGTRPLNKAFKNRFAIKLRFDYDPEIEAEILEYPVLQVIAAKLRDAHRRGDISTPISTNMLFEFEDFATELGLGFAIENFVNSFNEAERPAVEEVIELNRARINTSFGVDYDNDDGLGTAMGEAVTQGYEN